jgi:hypothetical protein
MIHCTCKHPRATHFLWTGPCQRPGCFCSEYVEAPELIACMYCGNAHKNMPELSACATQRARIEAVEIARERHV